MAARSHRVRLSKFLSYSLRHAAAEVGLQLDAHGWARLSDLLAVCTQAGLHATRAELLDVMVHGDKQRFEVDELNDRVRSTHGHSLDVDLGLVPEPPPTTLFHGTHANAVARTLAVGLHRMKRQYVHLSSDVETATVVGQRRGHPVVLRIDAAQLHADGGTFFRSSSGVWLTREVPPRYITVAWQARPGRA